jgi:hypothetical protein
LLPKEAKDGVRVTAIARLPGDLPGPIL